MTPKCFFSAEKVKRGLDAVFGAAWHVVVGEDFAFDLDYESNHAFHILYGQLAILGWKASASVDTE